ncbi:hypothetical protein JFZ35_004375 [Escherichia coli]|nr:hypothetical protein [Escherichia coli]
MRILRQMWNQKGLDAAVEDVPEDRYGFSNIAGNISRSILSLPQEASNVVGIEGAWGSGKTSLLNLILKNLALNKDGHTHVLHNFGHQFFPGSGLGPVGKEGSNAARRYMLHLTMKLIREHPLLGNDYGSFEALYGRQVVLEPDPKCVQSASVAHPHNELLYTWAEGGVVALAGLLLMVIAVIRRLWSPGGTGLAGLALFLPLAVHSCLEYPLYLSASHGLILVMLLVISGPGVAMCPAENNHRLSRPYQWLVVFIKGIAALLAMSVLIFMMTGLVTHQRLMAIEASGMIPLSERETEVLSELVNPYALHTRVNFDLHVARLLRFNQTRDPQLLIEFWDWGNEYIRTHNDPEVYRSLLKIAYVLRKSEAETLFQQAHGRWPADPGFICAGEPRLQE